MLGRIALVLSTWFCLHVAHASASASSSTQMIASSSDRYYTLQIGSTVDRLGFSFAQGTVTFVTPGSWAQKNGIETGDKIRAIGEKKFKELSQDEKIGAMQQRPTSISFKRPLLMKYFSLECAEAQIGMNYTRGTITTLVQGGWAERHGVKRGDKIVNVNHEPADEDDDAALLKMLQAVRPVIVTFTRPANAEDAGQQGGGSTGENQIFPAGICSHFEYTIFMSIFGMTGPGFFMSSMRVMK